MKELRIAVRDKIATLVNDVELVCGNSDYRVIFEFDEDWAKYNAKTALFVFGDTTVEVPFTGNTIWEKDAVAIEKATKCYIGVFTGDLITTTKAEVKCLTSIRDIAKTPKPPKEDVYNKIIELIHSIKVSGSAIIDVEELPTEDINTAVFYRTPNGTYWFDGEWHELANGTELIAEIERLVDEAEDTLSKKIDHKVAIQDDIITENKAIVEQANATSEEAKEIAEAISGIATESLKVANRAYEEKQDILAFDGEYNADRNKAATVETVTRKVAEIVANAPEDFDTLKELADWLTTHGGEAAQMNSAIKKNADDIVAERERAMEAESSLQESIEEASRQIEENILPQIVNADYNENNPESKAFIMNRPFFEEDAPENKVDINWRADEESGYLNGEWYVYFVSDQTFTKDELLDTSVPFEIDVKYGDGEIRTVNLFKQRVYGGNNITVDLGGLYIYVINDYENFGIWRGSGYGAPTKNGIYFTNDTYNGKNVNRLHREGKRVNKIDNKFIDGYDKLKAQADETERIAKGANPAKSYDKYSNMVYALNNGEEDMFYKGQNINIVTMGVPDLWVKDIVADKVFYDYYSTVNGKTGDAKIVAELDAKGYIQVGYYQLARLETQKVYLQDYVKYSDEPGNCIAGGKPGPIALNYATSCGLRIEGTAGKRYLTVYPGTDQDWVRRNGRCALVISQLDVYMKMGITGRKIVNGVESLGNQIELTDEEKASAHKWLGVAPASHEQFDIEVDYTNNEKWSVKVDGYNGQMYLVSSTAYPPDWLICATIEYKNSSSFSSTTTITESMVTNQTENGYTIKVGSYAYMFVAYNETYIPDIPNSTCYSPRAGVYFLHYDNGDPCTVESITNATRITVDNNALALENNAVIKSLLARIEALENK